MSSRPEDRENLLASFLRRMAPFGGIDEIISAHEGMNEGVGHRFGQSALENITLGRKLSPEEHFALEAIIIPEMRPSVLITDGTYHIHHKLWTHLNAPAVKAMLSNAIQSVGRIELPDHPSLPYGGTGFVVGPSLLMTNRHVAEIFTRGIGIKGLTIVSGQTAGVDFLAENGNPNRRYLQVRRVVMIHPYWDMALLEVEIPQGSLPHLTMSLLSEEECVGREVAVVGYPAFDSRNPADVQSRVFDGIYDVKRLMPGVVSGKESIVSYGNRVGALGHDSSTLGGASGSALIDVQTGLVLGLHFAGIYMISNYAVPACQLGRDGRVVDAGVTFQARTERRTVPWEDAWRRADPETVGQSLRGVPGGENGPPDARAATKLTGGEVTLRIPLDVTIRLGQSITAQFQVTLSGDTPPGATVERMIEPFRERTYDNRRGYDPNFLGIAVEMPRPADSSLAAPTLSGKTVLPYHNFSIVMHADRRLAMITAANVDASATLKRPEPLPASAYNRDGLTGLGPGDQEKWFPDPRLDARYQLSDRFFNKDRQAFDKGHLVRREDVAWGSTYAALQAANGDTYHITNCSPQVAGFNRFALTPDDDNWGDLENLILSQARSQRLAVFAGPVLDAADRIFIGVDDVGPIQIGIPSRYWKVVAAVDAGRLKSFGFILEQDLGNVAFEFVAPPHWARRMIPIAEIERQAGIVFPDNLRAADQASRVSGRTVRRRTGITLATTAPPHTQPIEGRTETDSPVGDLLNSWRREQRAQAGTPGVRFTLEYTCPVDDAAVAEAISERLGLRVELGPLFAADPALDGFRLLRIPSVGRPDRADLFDLARLIQPVAEAESVEPDLGSDFFQSDVPPPNLGSPESADWAFWCWAPEEDKPDDPHWALSLTKVKDAWAASEAAGRQAKGRGIMVFQPDTGVDPTHPELPRDLHTRPGAANFVEPGQPPIDPMNGSGNSGHGTGTGSVVASPLTGRVSGVAPEATLVPIRCIESVAVFDQSRVAQAIDHARRHGGHVITMSLGGVFSSALRAAVKEAIDANIIVMAAAGNCVGQVVWPARYDEVIAVAGINSRFRPWQGSCRGPAVDISGPAEFVLRAKAGVPGDPAAVEGGQGTSFAVAHLAGLAALWLAHHGREELIGKLPAGLRLQHVFQALIRSTAHVPEGFDLQNFGAGIVDAAALLAADPLSVLGQETVFAPAVSNSSRQVADLLAEVLGQTGLESVGPMLGDPLSAMELAAIAFYKVKVGKTPRAAVEALPPPAMSAGLRAALGSRAKVFLAPETAP
ncbi:DNA/RNA non-specific endonuclease [Asticcacaulis sp.]|uniref:DNA/RNA non-specific endonuclease n=1 Tax=Asticcacaulis sp. TaxID=1872648 RepID=UPI002617E9C5|nr:DNA/RNA non-specific endonuclease [Asticcacaulis sp.]